MRSEMIIFLLQFSSNFRDHYLYFLKNLGFNSQGQKDQINFISVKLGARIDQILEEAAAQIQVVLRKADDKTSLS